MKNRRNKTLNKTSSAKVAAPTVPLSKEMPASPLPNVLSAAKTSDVSPIETAMEANHPLASVLGTYEGTFWEEIFDGLEQDRRSEDAIEDAA